MKKLLEKWMGFITPKVLAGVFTAGYALTLIPLLLIARYNFPSADDYSFGDTCRYAWRTTHSIWQVLKEAFLLSWESYFNWMGSFTSEVVSALHPAVFKEEFYSVTTWIMLGMLTFSTVYLLKGIFVKVFKADKYMARIAIMAVLFVSIQCLSRQGRVEAFYWYCGSVRYVFLHSMSLFFYGIMVRAACSEGKGRIRYLTGASVLGFLIGGGNQMTSLNVAIVLGVALVCTICTKNRKKYKAFWIPMGCFYLGFIVSAAAPGNWVRTSGTAGMGAVKSVLVSFYYCLDYVLGEWTGWPVLLLIAILIPLFWHMAEKTEYGFRYPVIVVLFGYCLVSAMITPPLFAVGNIEAGRLQALIFFMYILVLTLCVGYVTGWVRRQWDKSRGTPAAREAGFSANTRFCLMGCVFFFLLASGLSIIPEPHFYSFTSAITDLKNGSARAYGEALEQRVQIYNSDVQGILEVEPLPAEPALLYFSDITPDVEDWQNKALARFYGKDGVIVKRVE